MKKSVNIIMNVCHWFLFLMQRQIGFDQAQHPVIYACYNQNQTKTCSADDVITHVIYLIENSIKCNKDKLRPIIFIIDCNGKYIF